MRGLTEGTHLHEGPHTGDAPGQQVSSFLSLMERQTGGRVAERAADVGDGKRFLRFVVVGFLAGSKSSSGPFVIGGNDEPRLVFAK